MGPVSRLVQKEFRQIFRDPVMLRLIILMPLVQLFVLGNALSTDLKGVRVSVLNQDPGPASRQLEEALLVCDTFVPGPQVHTPHELDSLLIHGHTDLTLWIPTDWRSRLARGESVPPGLFLDGRNSSQAGQAAGQALQILGTPRLNPVPASAGTRSPGRVVLRERTLYNPELVSKYNMVPGIVVVLITVISAMLTGMTVVREKELGTLEQLLVSPLTAGQLVLGKTLPLAILAYGELILATTIAVIGFQLPLAGSIPLLALAVALYLLVTIGGGLLASTVSQTQQQAVFTVWFFLIFAILLSGFFFPVANMPDTLRWLTLLNPMRYIIEIVRGIFLKASDLSDLWPQMAALAGLGSLSFSLALWRFRKRLD
ncbi:MAG: ABC transporter permease [Candidatus Cloacimonetes bacterium]|nr:ABC transporter permease [Candidatus Cloacimonadota bacterium]